MPHYEQNDFLLADNAPVHVSASTSKWMTDKNVQKIIWPSYSPNLNPMENLWGIMSRRIYGNGHLKKSIQTAWRWISTETVKSLSSSMKDRIFECTLKRVSYRKF